jgi:predicted nucleic acid-binding protein
MILCDTNIFISAFNGRHDTVKELRAIGYDNIAISSITVMELYQGMGNKNELAVMKKNIRYFDVIHLSAAISLKAVDYIERFRLSHNLQIPDAIIGATAAISGIELFTYNTRDFDFLTDVRIYAP